MNEREHHLLRIALAGFGDIEEWRLGDPARAAALGYPRDYPAPAIDDYGIVFVDVTLDAVTGEPVCHEVNGPNGVGSDALTGESSRRAALEARQAARRVHELGLVDTAGTVRGPVVALHAHQHWSAFRTGGEFYPRVDRFRSLLEEALPGNRIELRSPDEDLGDEAVTVVAGDVPAVAAGLLMDRASTGFRYRDAPVIFAGNPNLVPELVRTGRMPAPERVVGPEFRVFHAWRLVHLVHDKGRQQALLRGTGIRPLAWFEAASRAEAIERVARFAGRSPCVLKPNSASGGVGVHVVVPGMPLAEIASCVDAVIADHAAKYGPNSESVVFPIRGFEFARSTGYPMEDGDHLWDLRIAVMFEPGRASVHPVSLRLAPRPFDPDSYWLDRDQWVSNVSGRRGTLLKSGMDREVLTAVGVTDECLEQIFDASVRWTMNAWDVSARGDSALGPVFEDEREMEDASFYPRDKFLR
jgi:hypothetical protein